MRNHFQDLIHSLAYGVLLGIYIWVVANNVQVIMKSMKSMKGRDGA